ncbi:MAG: sulfurtransferase [Anaerolineae bacterium]|nr:sulfurtransferase [Anaerolineae bacterium]
MSDITARGYTHPEVLVSTEWLAAHLTDPNIRIVESNEDPLLYAAGHIPGAVEVDWTRDLNDQVVRDYVGREAFEALAQRSGITRDTTVIFYGDKNNWWATYAFWVFQLFGHTSARILDGGRKKWEAEGRPLTRDRVTYPASSYTAPERDDVTIRAFKEYVLQHVKHGGQLVDVRSPAEFTGEKTHMPEYPQEGVLRGGHIPGAKSVPWARAVNEDGSFKDAAALQAIYQGEKQLDPEQETIAYCRIGERSSHTWFVLTYLLGFKNVRNYDGSWTEWGNSVGVPIAKGAE